MIVTTAKKYHYSPRPLDDGFSKLVYASFLKMLDPNGTLFTEELLDRLDRFTISIDEEIMQRKTAFLDTVTALYIAQMHTADSLIRELTDRTIDFTAADTLWLGGKKQYAKSRELNKKWERWIRYMILLAYHAQKDSAKTDTRISPEKASVLLERIGFNAINEVTPQPETSAWRCDPKGCNQANAIVGSE